MKVKVTIRDIYKRLPTTNRTFDLSTIEGVRDLINEVQLSDDRWDVEAEEAKE